MSELDNLNFENQNLKNKNLKLDLEINKLKNLIDQKEKQLTNLCICAHKKQDHKEIGCLECYCSNFLSHDAELSCKD
jgi:ferredoxin-thioredoxin reductase catalytic subunit